MILILRAGEAPHAGFSMVQGDSPDSDYGFGPRIEGPLSAWRGANPWAVVANVRGRLDLTDADFAHLKGIKALDMSGCTHPGLTDAALAQLRGLHTLNMIKCCQPSITDAAFAHLHGLHTLGMNHCTQLTDAAFTHLRGIQLLSLHCCNSALITGATFAHLRGLRQLEGAPAGARDVARLLGLAVK